MPADPKRPADPIKSKAPTGGSKEAVDERLEPLEEFRGRSESWMKEITGQVARLASRNEEDDRRRKNLDKRLGDIEQRIQSLLTLTEMLSIGSNPFVASTGPRPQETAPPSAALYATPPAAPAAAPVAPVVPARAASTTNGVPVSEPLVRFEAADSPSGPDEDAGDAVAVGSHAKPAPASPGAAGSYFSDLLRPTPATPPATGTAEPVYVAPPPPAPDPSAAAAERLVLLEWAELLASRLPRGHMHAFLSRYEEAGWIDADTVDRVLALASGLEVGHPDAPTPKDLHDLHVRSLVLLSFLEGRPIPQSEALDVLNEARTTTHGDWANAIR